MKQAKAAPADILLVSTADWDNPYWTNKQHVAVELGRRGHRVLYIESQGLRRPTATARDLRRIWHRLKKALRRPRRVRENVWVSSPILIPLQRSRIVRKLNRHILALQVRLWLWIIGSRPKIFWTYSPLTTDLYATSGYDAIVYHAVDDIKEQPGMPREAIAAAETELAVRADVIFATAPHIHETLKKLNPECHYFPNVADFAHFNTALLETTGIPDDIARIQNPIIGFIGAVSGYKMDFRLLRIVADARPDWSIVLIGEVGEGDPWTDISTLSGAANIHLMGGRPYASLPAYLKAFDVAILPSNLNEYTRSMFPMKFFEYLAAGRPVVATPLPAIADYSEVAALCEGAEAFELAIAAALTNEAAPLDRRLAAAKEQTYEIRTEKMMRVVNRLQASN
jgi:glycosyltransferase involved in cell wall biosynthesis